MSENTPTSNQERMNLLVTIWKNRKLLLITSVAALVVSGVIAFLMTPIYRSTAVVFPAATSTVSFSEQRNAKASSMDFGEEEQAEQLIQILSSSKVRDIVVERFNLMEHYGIDKNDPNKYYKLVTKYGDNILFVRTRYGSIQIDVLDRDPVLAADMANKIVDLIDTVKNEMVKERTLPAYEINKRKKDQMVADRDTLLKQLERLADQGVLPNDARATLYQALVDSKSPQEKEEIRKKIEVNNKFGSVYDALEYQRNEKIVKIEDFNVSYEQAESDANANFNHKFVVERAVVADKKDRPKRLVIMILAVGATFIFMVFAILLRDKLKELRSIS